MQQKQILIGPILFLYYKESLVVSSNLNSKQLMFRCVRPNVGRYIHLVNKPKTKVYVGTFRAAKPFIASTDRVVEVVEFKLTC